MKLVLGVIAFALSFNALANDGGVAHINVQGITPATKNEFGDTEIKFYGKDAAHFMRLLPGYSSVLYSMVRPDVAAQLKNNQRGVSVVSNGWTLSFNCNAGEISEGQNDIKKANFVPKTPECTISLSRGGDLDNLGDTWSMEPSDYEGKVCTK